MRQVWCALVLAVLVSAAPAANIRRIEFEGFQRVPVGVIRPELPLKPGQEYDPALLTKVRDWLTGQGVFISAEVIPQQQGQVVDLLIRVKENPVVQAIRITGNTQVATAALRPLLITRPRDLLNRRVLSQDASLIGNAYLEAGLRVVVEVGYDPPPTDSAKPVTVIYKLTEIRVAQVRIEPLHYLRSEQLTPFLVLQPGELVQEARLLEQQKKLRGALLFERVDDPATGELDAQGRVPVTYRVAEAEHPLVTAASLPFIDLPKLARFVRFSAVEVTIDSSDFELWVAPDELARRRTAAAAAAVAAPADPAAQWAALAATRRLGDDPSAAATRARPVLERAAAAGSGLALYRLGVVLQDLGERQAAFESLTKATQDPSARLEAWTALLNLRAATHDGQQASLDALRQTVADALAAVVALPEPVTLPQLTAAYRLYHTALSLSLLNLHLTDALKLDGPAGQRLIAGVYQLANASPSPAEARQLGRFVTAAGFAAQTLGGVAADDPGLKDYVELLGVARRNLLTKGLDDTADPAAWFYLALNDVLREDTAQARATVLDGLRRQPNNERLVDVYVLTCVRPVATRATEPQRIADLLRESVRGLQGQLADGSLAGWGARVMLAKLNLGLRDNLPADDLAGREEARQSAEAAARSATAADAQQPAGWWLLGLAQMKSARPGLALDAYQHVYQLAPGYREVRYALALAKLAAGDTDGGLQAMQELVTPKG